MGLVHVVAWGGGRSKSYISGGVWANRDIYEWYNV